MQVLCLLCGIMGGISILFQSFLLLVKGEAPVGYAIVSKFIPEIYRISIIFAVVGMVLGFTLLTTGKGNKAKGKLVTALSLCILAIITEIIRRYF